MYKRRLALTLPAALAFVSGLPYEQACARWPLSDAALAAAALSPATRQIARELEAAMDRWLPLVPSMGIACDRAAWAYRPEMFQEREGDELFDSELRITFDDCLEYLDCHRFRSPWRPIIESSESVMEIKSAGPTRRGWWRFCRPSASTRPRLPSMATLIRWQRLSRALEIIEGLCVVVREPFGKCESWK